MIRHIIIAAWRNMAANRLISAIAILGLTVGIAAALLMALVARNQMSFDGDLLRHERTYLAISPPDPRAPPVLGWQKRSDYRLAAFLKRAEPAVENAARITLPYADETERLQHGAVTGWEQVYWADPGIFDLLPLPVLHGDLATALQRPDGIVLPRAAARKYFGRDNVVGQTMLLNGHPMMVRAVIADRPANGTTLTSGIFASGRAAFSRLPSGDMAQNAVPASVEIDAFTYIRLRPHADLAGIERRAAAHFLPEAINSPFPLLKLVPVVQVNMFEALNPGIGLRLAAASLAGSLVLLVAIANFVNLMVARSARRQREVGVRKALGADRAALMFQFLGEALLATLLAISVAVALSEWLLPPMNAFLGTGAGIDYAGLPLMALLLPPCALMLALAAGAWPALLLSSFRPTAVLRGLSNTVGSRFARGALVGLQFAILTVLAISAWVIWQQRQFALHEALRADTDRMLILKLSLADAPFRPASACVPAFLGELRKLSGVQGAACSGSTFLSGKGNFIADAPWLNGRRSISTSNAEPQMFALYGIKPLAGNLESKSGTIINLAAVHMLGFPSPAAAIGHTWVPAAAPARPLITTFRSHGTITAVVPDFAFYSVERAISPELFGPWFGSPQVIHVKLRGQGIPETLVAIDRLWLTTGMKGPENRTFLDEQLQQQYLDITRQAVLLAAFAAAAIFLACLGLFGVAVSTAERRTKEIGIRKAMGADNRQIVALLLWQFAQPVLWANVIAWPAAWWLMRRWLSGFAYHIDLHWWVFAGASLGALAVALLTVAGQAFLTARQKPVLALRTE